jgi:hypothetical protein
MDFMAIVQWSERAEFLEENFRVHASDVFSFNKLKTTLPPTYKSHSTPAAPATPRAQIHLVFLSDLRGFKIFVTQLIC